MSHLGERMDTRIRASSTKNRRPLASEGINGVFQHLLHSEAVFLMLPTYEAPAVVFNGHAIAGHDSVLAGSYKQFDQNGCNGSRSILLYAPIISRN